MAAQSGITIIPINRTKYLQLESPEMLLERAQQLDRQALAEIHDLYYPAVYRYVRYRLDDEQIVEDISAEVFLQLIDHLHKKKGEIHNLRGWLLGTAANMVNDHLRNRYRKPVENLEDYEALTAADDPHAVVEHLDAHQQVRKAILQLTREQQHVLALRFSQGLSVEETAQLMNKTVGAIKLLQFRALSALRKMLRLGEKAQ